MAKHKQGVIAVTGMMLVVFSIALMVPAMVISLENPQDISLEQTEGQRQVLSGTLTTYVNNIQAGGNPSVNLTLVNERTGEVKTTGELAEGDTITLQFTNGNVTVTDIDVLSDTEAIIRYEYPTYIGYPANAEILFKNIELFLVVITIMMLAGVLIVVREVFE